jgi:FtsZ-binding cell division protein ZapB
MSDSDLNQELDVDALSYLEERIQKAVALVRGLRAEKESLAAEKEALAKELAETQAAWEEAQTSNQKLADQLQALQSERHKVRNRLEVLLGQIDQLGAE